MNRLLALVATMICISGCDFIPLYDLEGNVMIYIDYNLEQQVYVRDGFDPTGVPTFSEKVHGKMPEHVQVQFYEVGTHTLVKDEFLDAEGGIMSVTPGFYDIIIYSLETKVTQVEGTTLSGMLATTEMTHSLYSIGGYYDAITEPDHLYLATLENVEVLPARDDLNTITYVYADASSILETWTFEMLNVDGMEYIASCELYITSQEGRAFLWGDRNGNKPGALKISAYPDFQNKRLYSVFNTFGRYPNYRDGVSAVLKVTNTAGNEYIYEFDVTDQFDDPNNIGHNIVVDQHFTIPGDGGTGGFEPVVDPWWDPIIVSN